MLLANKEILSWILRETVEEFQDMQIAEIKECIEPGIEITSMAVHPNTPDKITGTEFAKSNYQDIKKVYSIWLCMNCEENGMTKFSFSKQDVMGHLDALKEEYDLMAVIIVRLTSEYDASQMSAMIRILNILLSKAGIYSGQKKIKMLKDEGVQISQEIEEEVIDMCNWSEGIADRAKAEGMEMGIEQGAVGSIRILLGFSMDKQQIQRSVQSEFELTEEQFERIYKQAVEGDKS